jgi:hypothetical protein
MKKILFAFVAFCMMCACSGEREYLNCHGLSMSMSAKAMADSFEARGLAVDTSHSNETQIVLADTLACNYTLVIYQHNDTISDILETYIATYNDSTSQLWQKLHDELQKELDVWPGMPHHGDLHKEADYTTGAGTIVLTLLNTYSPTVTVRYSTQINQ